MLRNLTKGWRLSCHKHDSDKWGYSEKKLKGLRNYEGSAFISCEGFP